MVDGCKIENQKCVIVDLDGTLIKNNSLIFLTEALIKKLLKIRLYKELQQLLLFIFKRKLKLIPHSEMKHKIVEFSNKHLSAEDLNSLGDRIYHDLNEEVLEMIYSASRQGEKILLATAAADLYLPVFAKHFPDLDLTYIGTTYNANLEEYIENKGSLKLKNVKTFLNKHNLTSSSVISDNEDDIPLFKNLEGNKYLVSPSRSTLNAFQRELKDFRYIKRTSTIYQVYSTLIP